MPRGHIYTKDQIITALTLYNKLQSMPKVVELLGYPSVSMLCEWKRMYPELLTPQKRKKPRKWVQATNEFKMYAIRRCINNGETIKSIAEDIGYSSVAVWKWVHEYTEKGSVSLMKKTDPNIPIDPKDIQSAEDIDALKARMIDMQMEIDILKETINVLKKDPGVNQEALSNREKAVIIDALKNKYSLPKLCRKLVYLAAVITTRKPQCVLKTSIATCVQRFASFFIITTMYLATAKYILFSNVKASRFQKR